MLVSLVCVRRCYGYSGLFDAVKVDEQALDKLYEFDEAMLGGVDRVSVILDDLAEAVEAEDPTPSQANDLIAELEALNATFSGRQDVLLS